MNTHQLTRLLPSNVRHAGVYAADRIPLQLPAFSALIVNTDCYNFPGKHWNAIFIDYDNTGFFFDSYGMPPYVPHHLDSLRRNCKRIFYNTITLQSDQSNVCGQFCIAFLHAMSRGVKLAEFQNYFVSDRKQNDARVVDMVRAIVRENEINTRKYTAHLNSVCQTQSSLAKR